MKKVVVAMLLLLPLVIVASVLLATSVIVHEVYIAVEGVELNVQKDKTIELGLSQGSFQLDATVYPTGARNRDVEWSVENVVCFGDEIADPVTIEDGKVTFLTYCAFDAVVTTVEGRKTARCNFYVKCDEMRGLTFAAPENLEVGERAELSVVLDPVDAEVYDVAWVSSDPTVLDVDKNGILTGVKPGTALVTASAQEYTCQRSVTVLPSVTKYGKTLSTARDTLTFSDLGVTEAVALSGATIDGQTITINADVAELRIGGETVVIKKVADEVTIKNGDLLAARTYYVDKAPLYLETEYADVFRTGLPQAELTLSGDATMTDGKVTFSKKGEITVTVTDGLETYNTIFNAVQPVAYVRLNTVDADDKRGIANRSVYGTQSYGESGLVGYEIPLRIQYPEDADWEDFSMEVDREDLLEITSDHTVRVKQNVDEPTVVTVSVTAHYSQFLSVPARANRHFTLIDGINCSTYQEVLRAAADERAIALRKDIASASGAKMLEIKKDFFGNGYMLDVSATDKGAEDAVLRVKASGVTVSNAYVRCDDGVKINNANGLHGAAVWVGSQEEEYLEDFEYLTDVRVEYSIMENGYYCAAATRADVTFDGCIFRNASNFGIFVVNDRQWVEKRAGGYDYVSIFSNVVVNNSIVSDIIAPAVGISAFASDGPNPISPQSTFSQTGFFDVYNWQDVTSDAMLGRDFLPNNDSANALFRRLITSFLGEELAKSEYDRICYRTEEHSYIHLGVITAGALNQCTTVPTFEDPRFKVFPLKILESDLISSMTNAFLGHELYRINVYVYEVDEDITPEMRFVADKAAFAKLRGE